MMDHFNHFNVVRYSDERKGLSTQLDSSKKKMYIFIEFMNNVELMGIPMIRRKFT